MNLCHTKSVAFLIKCNQVSIRCPRLQSYSTRVSHVWVNVAPGQERPEALLYAFSGTLCGGSAHLRACKLS
jgi:hypothetical protein